MRLDRTTLVPASLAEVFTFFAAEENLAILTPPKTRFRVVRGPGRPLRQGDLVEYRMRVFGLPFRWISRISLWRDQEVFADAQERGPFRSWLHTHSFRPVEGGVEMHDVVEYELPFGILGRVCGGWLMRRELERIFDYRAQAIKRQFSGK